MFRVMGNTLGNIKIVDFQFTTFKNYKLFDIVSNDHCLLKRHGDISNILAEQI